MMDMVTGTERETDKGIWTNSGRDGQRMRERAIEWERQRGTHGTERGRQG